tara:strand:- start:1468 stop:2283 length:816 start_codon:yes stop_codon:yes gene_type:complete
MSGQVIEARFEAAQKNGLTTFKSVLEELLNRHELNQFKLSIKLDCSQSYLSKIERGKRDLTPPIAERFAKHLGGTKELWLEVFSETKFGGSKPISHYLGKIKGAIGDSSSWGTPIRQLRRDEIIGFFDRAEQGEIKIKIDDVEIDCGIEDFNPSRVSMTSYDMCLGGFATERGEDGEWDWQEAGQNLIIPAGKTIALMAKGRVQMPDWLEAEIHQPSNIALKPLFVANGPVIDPCWGGHLKVVAFNPSENDVEVLLDEPLITLRFWVAAEA